MENSNYSVLIRTLGTAGQKYLRTLQAIDRQTLKPEKIYVALPHGYAKPTETIGKETIIYVQKGMVAQRAFAFGKVENVKYLLLLDDDVDFASDFVQTMIAKAEAEHADAVTPKLASVAYEQKLTGVKQQVKLRLKKLYLAMILHKRESHRLSDYFIRISRGGGFIVNVRAEQSDQMLLTQSGIGICSLCRLDACLAIHFEDDLWLEKYEYALPDDQVFFYKMHLSGYKVIHASDCRFEHLDAKSGNVKAQDAEARAQRFQKLSARNYALFWYLYIYRYSRGSAKLLAILAFAYKTTATLAVDFAQNILGRHWGCLTAGVKGYAEAYGERKELAGQVRMMVKCSNKTSSKSN